MTIDELAKIGPYRIRNMHDGYPVPPTRRRGRRGSDGYWGPADRFDAVIGRRGFAHVDGVPAGRIGWVLLCKSGRALIPSVAAIRAMGGAVRQIGTNEAAGDAPESCAAALLETIRAWKRRAPRRPGEQSINRPHD